MEITPWGAIDKAFSLADQHILMFNVMLKMANLEDQEVFLSLTV